MKMKVTGLKTLLQVTAVISIIGVCSIAQAAMVVNLSVNGSEDKLEITTHGNCSSNNTNGCLKVTGNELINFVLTQKQCSAGGKWSLSTVTLGTVENGAGGLDPQVAKDFDANATSGLVTPESSNDSHIQIRDDNTVPSVVYYTVTATCPGMDPINSDPRIINDGTGNPP